MTYEQALQWLIENVPIEFYDTYKDWYDACKSELTGSIWQNSTFNRMHEDYYKDNHVVQQQPREIVFEQPPTYRPPEPQYKEPVEQPLPTEEQRQVPQTGKAPELPKPNYEQSPVKRPSIFQRFRRLFRR